MPATTRKKPQPVETTEPEARMIRTDHIVSQSAIARRFGTSDQAVWNWTQRPDFPEPLPGTDCGRPVWDWEEIENWEKNWVRSKGGYHTHKSHQGERRNGSRPRRQWMEGDPEE